jgi:hypothetical protein
MVLSSNGGDRIVVHFAVAGELAAFRTVEGFAGGAPIKEMHVHVSDIFS